MGAERKRKSDSTDATSTTAFIEDRTSTDGQVSKLTKRKDDTDEQMQIAAKSARKAARKVTAAREQLLNLGFKAFSKGLPWTWELIPFVDEMHRLYHKEVEERLDSLKDQWHDGSSSGRSGWKAAEIVSEAMKRVGVAVYVPPASQQEQAPWEVTGPRFYISVTDAAWKKWPDGVPAPADELAEVLWPHEADSVMTDGKFPNMVRGLGWALAPANSDPQSLHADIWGYTPRPGRVRFHHLLWKRAPGALCTTQVVPGGFTSGATSDKHYQELQTASAPFILVDNEVLHRGAKNTNDHWVSTCSIELCTRTGYEEVWKGGGEDDGVYIPPPIRWSRPAKSD